MSEARIDRIANENNTGGPTLSGITTFSGQNYFVPPRGTTAERPSNCPVGSIRFNTDSAKLEYFDSLQWLELEAFNVEIGQAGALGNRGVFAGGYILNNNLIDYITLSTLGNAIDFGDLIAARGYAAGCSSSTRGIIAGGSDTNTIQYLTISSTGNSIDFGGILTSTHRQGPGCSNSTRGVFMGGYRGPSPSGDKNTIDYVTIASTGNAVDFGDLTRTVSANASCASSTRGISAGGFPTNSNIIDFVTIASTGNAIDFGDLYRASARLNNSGCSNSTRGLFAGAYSPGDNIIQYITIASTGNSQDFGDLLNSIDHTAGVSSPTRGVWGGGRSNTNVIQYVTIATTGNAQDFGDLTVARNGAAPFSNGHGGL